MSLYESTFIIRHDMSAQQVEQLAEGFTEILKNNGGDVTKTEFWGLKTLAYRINKNRKGHYVFFNVDAPAAALHEFERNMRISEDVLRYLTVRVDELDPEPSPMMQVRTSRDDRTRRGRPEDDVKKTDAAKPDAPKKEDDSKKETASEEKAPEGKAPEEATPEAKADDGGDAAEPESDEPKKDEPKTDEKGEPT